MPTTFWIGTTWSTPWPGSDRPTSPARRPATTPSLTAGWSARSSAPSLADVVADDLAQPLGLDGLFLGCPPEERHRVAPLEPMRSSRSALPSAVFRAEKAVGTQLAKGLSLVRSPVNPRRVINALLPRGMEDVLAGPEIMDASVPSMNGFFTARSLAALYAALAGGGALGDVRLWSAETVAKIGEEQNNRRDLVLVVPMRWRLGYHRVMTSRGGAPNGFGHFGLGGSGAWADPSRDLAIAMVCNRGGGTPVGDLRLMRLGAAAIASADRVTTTAAS